MNHDEKTNTCGRVASPAKKTLLSMGANRAARSTCETPGDGALMIRGWVGRGGVVEGHETIKKSSQKTNPNSGCKDSIHLESLISLFWIGFSGME